MRKLFTEELPHNWRGVDWKQSIGHTLHFIYDDVTDDFKIVNYIKGANCRNKIVIDYKNKETIISITDLERMNIKNFIGATTSKTIIYKYSIGDRFIDDKRDIEIINRIVRKNYRKSHPNELVKIYVCKCHKCGDETIEITESHLNQKRGCPTCHGKKVTIGVNNLATTDPWMIPYFVNKQDTLKYTSCSSANVEVKCPFCGSIKKHKIMRLYKDKKISCKCSDSISYPEKFMINLLEQLKIDFIYQPSAKDFSWCQKYKYDFYIPKFNTIIETNGEQHYKSTSGFFGNIDKIINNDLIKEKTALSNGIKNYIKIDCRKSELNYIKDSNLIQIFQRSINDIDWELCNLFATKNIINEVCNYKKEYPFSTSAEISALFHIDRCTVSRYLKKGAEYGWCIYGGQSRCIEIYRNGNSLGIYNSAKDISQKSLCEFNIYLNAECIKRVCRNETSQYKGFTFKYVS